MCFECWLKRKNPKRYKEIMLQEQGLRHCNKCGMIKKMDEFVRAHTKNGISNPCKICYCKYQQKYKKEHPKTYKHKSRRPLSLNDKIVQRFRTRISLVIKKNTKYFKFWEVVGCSLEFLKKYLESKFTEGMTWENYGKYGWHIDHIRPCASFDLSDPEQQKQCFHYSNLQPLWWRDNYIKGSFYNGKLYRKRY